MKNIFERTAERIERNENKAFNGQPFSDNFFEITTSTVENEVGDKWPQIRSINIKSSHSLKFDEFPEKKIVFKSVRIYRSSILTDCLSTSAISAHHLILSKKAATIFRRFNLGRYRVYPTTVKRYFKSYDYETIHLINDQQQNMDFEKSEFYVADLLGAYRFDIDVNDENDFYFKRNQIKEGVYPGTKKWWNLRTKSTVFKDAATLPDIFTIKCSGNGLFAKKGVADQILENCLTGFTIKPVQNLKN